jgi:hypothetical protein
MTDYYVLMDDHENKDYREQHRALDDVHNLWLRLLLGRGSLGQDDQVIR